jgi:MFS family permease
VTSAVDGSTAPPTRTPLTAELRLLAVGLVLGVVLVAFESTALITALPTITDELGGDSLYGVSLAVYTLANMVALIVAGQVADRRGPTSTFVVSIGIFVIGLLLAGAATSMWVVVAGRTLQGFGSGGFSPIAYMLVKRAFPADRQPMMYVFLSAGWVVPSLVAPVFSGIVTEQFGWRWVFFMIVPLAIGVGAVASAPMRHLGAATGGDHAPSLTLPAVGAALGVGVLLLALASGTVWQVVIGGVAGAALGLHSLRRLLPSGFFSGRRGYPAVLTVRVLAAATFIGIDSFLPLAADRIHGATPMVQGFVIVGAALSWTGGQVLAARRPQARPDRMVRAGFILLATSSLLVAPVLWSGWPLWATFIGWAVGGLGMGVLYNPSTVVAMGYADDGREGLVSGQVRLTDALGFSMMYGVGGAIVAVADRGAITLQWALGVNFALSFGCAALGLAASRNVRARVVA